MKNNMKKESHVFPKRCINLPNFAPPFCRILLENGILFGLLKCFVWLKYIKLQQELLNGTKKICNNVVKNVFYNLLNFVVFREKCDIVWIAQNISAQIKILSP